MNYIKSVQKDLQHNNKRANIINSDVLQFSLWYSPTKQAYIQRTILFDNTWLISPTSDSYISLILKSIYALEHIVIVNKLASCNEIIDNLNEQDKKKNLMYVYKKDSDSLFTAYIESMRNGFAHGTFNVKDGRFYLINQQRPKIESPVTCIIQTDEEISSALNKFNILFEDSLSNPVEFKYECLKKELKLVKKENYFYSNSQDCYVIINDDFYYKNKSRREDLQQLFIDYHNDSKYVVILSENLGNISEEHLVSDDGKVKILSQSKLIDFFGIHSVVLRYNEANNI